MRRHRYIPCESALMCDAFLECGAEIFLFETFSDVSYISALVSYIEEEAAKKKMAMPFVMAQFCLNRYGYQLLYHTRNPLDIFGTCPTTTSNNIYSKLCKIHKPAGKILTVIQIDRPASLRVGRR